MVPCTQPGWCCSSCPPGWARGRHAAPRRAGGVALTRTRVPGNRRHAQSSTLELGLCCSFQISPEPQSSPILIPCPVYKGRGSAVGAASPKPKGSPGSDTGPEANPASRVEGTGTRSGGRAARPRHAALGAEAGGCPLTPALGDGVSQVHTHLMNFRAKDFSFPVAAAAASSRSRLFPDSM